MVTRRTACCRYTQSATRPARGPTSARQPQRPGARRARRVHDAELTYDFDIGVNPVELTGEGEPFDRVLQVYDADLRTLLPVRDEAGLSLSAADYVLGDDLVAFRSREPARRAGECDLNGDGDCADSVLLVYDVRASA